MDRDHVLASLLFPNFPGFSGKNFNGAKDKDLALLCVKVYNDWILEQWCDHSPGRFIGNILIPFWSPEEAAAEIERGAARGAKAFSFSEDPYKVGFPSIHDPGRYWDPVLAAANETGMVVTTHLGTGRPVQFQGDGSGSPPRISTILMELGQCQTLLDWLFSGHLQRFPNLKICLSEGGIGWIPYILEQATWSNRLGNRHAFNMAEMSDTPGDLPDPWEQFRAHIYGCFINDAHGARCLREIGIDNVMIEADYPHLSSEWPHTLELAKRAIGYLSPDEQYQILRGNAERVFDFQAATPPAPIGVGR
jgi:predicted TIM-barrel fold metal-dependent hydrolase